MTTDRDLILRSINDPPQFGGLFDRHATTLHRVMAGRVSTQVADDVIAETFLRAFERRQRFDVQRESALPWLFGIALNVLREQTRSNRRTVQYDLELPDTADAIGAAGNRVDAQRRLSVVLAALDRLPPGSRDAVLLDVVAGLSYEDIAAALRVPVGTVRSRLSRARAKLRAATTTLEEEGGRHGLDGTAPCAL